MYRCVCGCGARHSRFNSSIVQVVFVSVIVLSGQYSGEQTEVVPVHSSAGEGGQVVTVQWDKGRILSAPPGRAGKASQRK